MSLLLRTIAASHLAAVCRPAKALLAVVEDSCALSHPQRHE